MRSEKGSNEHTFKYIYIIYNPEFIQPLQTPNETKDLHQIQLQSDNDEQGKR